MLAAPPTVEEPGGPVAAEGCGVVCCLFNACRVPYEKRRLFGAGAIAQITPQASDNATLPNVRGVLCAISRLLSVIRYLLFAASAVALLLSESRPMGTLMACGEQPTDPY